MLNIKSSINRINFIPPSTSHAINMEVLYYLSKWRKIAAKAYVGDDRSWSTYSVYCSVMIIFQDHRFSFSLFFQKAILKNATYLFDITAINVFSFINLVSMYVFVSAKFLTFMTSSWVYSVNLCLLVCRQFLFNFPQIFHF